MIRVALRGVLARSGRLALTSLAIAIGVAFIVGTTALTDLLSRSVNDLIADAYRNYAVVVRSGEAQENPFSSIPLRPSIPAATLDLVRSVDGVAEAQGIVTTVPAMLDKQGKRISAFGPPIYAINWTASDALNGGRIIEGRPPAGPDEVAIDFKTAKDFGFAIGDPFTMELTRGTATLTIVGIGGIGSEGNKSSGGRIALMDTARLQELTDQVGRFSYIAVARDRDVSQNELATRISALLPAHVEATTGKQFIEENQRQVGRLIDIIGTFVSFFGYVSVFVAAFIIYNTFSILVAQRTQELALLRAVGASRPQILGSVVLEAVVVGLAATVIGIALGVGLATGLKSALGSLITLPAGIPRLTPMAVAVAFGVGMVATVGSALIPAFRSTSVPPLAALGGNEVDRSGLSRSRRIIGPLLLVGGTAAVLAGVFADWAPSPLVTIGAGAGAVFIGIAVAGPAVATPLIRVLGRPLPTLRGVTGRLATENAARNPKRTTVTAVTLTIGVGLVVVITVLASSVKGTFAEAFGSQLKADLIVDAGGFGGTGIAPDVRDAVAGVDGVEIVTSSRFAGSRVLNSKVAREVAAKAADGGPITDRGTIGVTGPPGQEAFVIGVDPDAFLRVASLGVLVPSDARLVDGTVFVAKRAAEENSWSAGDDVEMWFADVGTRTYRIAATFDQTFGQANYFMTLADFEQIAPPLFDVDTSLYVKLRDGVSVAAARDAVAAVVTPLAPAATVSNIGDYVREQTDQLNGFIFVIYVLLALAVIIALVGIGNTLALSILERRREIGLLRAIGMARPQLRTSIRLEAAVIATLGTVLGVAVGLGLAAAVVHALGNRGIQLHIVAWQLVAIALVGAVAGVLAAVRPARRGAAIDVLDAISAV